METVYLEQLVIKFMAMNNIMSNYDYFYINILIITIFYDIVI